MLSFERIAHAGGGGLTAGLRSGGNGAAAAAATAGGVGGGNPNTILMDTRGNVNLKLTVSGTNLDKKDFGIFGKSDPYFILSREAVPSIYRPVCDIDDSSTSFFFVESILMGGAPPLHAPHDEGLHTHQCQCPFESAASYLCHCVLTRGCTFR